MLSEQAQTLDLIVQLAKENEDIACMWLYGSRARGLSRPDSDYDMAVLFKSYIDDALLRRLRPEELAIDWALAIDAEVSVLDIQQAPILLAYAALLDNKPLYIADAVAKLNLERRVFSMVEHDLGYFRKDSPS